MRSTLLLVALAALTGCSLIPEKFGGRQDAGRTAPAGTVAPPPSPAGLRPTIARTADQLDTTTAAEREAAKAVPAAAKEARLGSTVASLGDPASQGFWLETSLVTSVRQGRVTNPKTGASVQVELRPVTGGSRISLAAMRLLGVSLTDLAELEVFAG